MISRVAHFSVPGVRGGKCEGRWAENLSIGQIGMLQNLGTFFDAVGICLTQCPNSVVCLLWKVGNLCVFGAQRIPELVSPP